jgi:hypothetical protein
VELGGLARDLAVDAWRTIVSTSMLIGNAPDAIVRLRSVAVTTGALPSSSACGTSAAHALHEVAAVARVWKPMQVVLQQRSMSCVHHGSLAKRSSAGTGCEEEPERARQPPRAARPHVHEVIVVHPHEIVVAALGGDGLRVLAVDRLDRCASRPARSCRPTAGRGTAAR